MERKNGSMQETDKIYPAWIQFSVWVGIPILWTLFWVTIFFTCCGFYLLDRCTDISVQMQIEKQIREYYDIDKKALEKQLEEKQATIKTLSAENLRGIKGIKQLSTKQKAVIPNRPSVQS